MSVRNATLNDSSQLKKIKPGLEDERIGGRLKDQADGKSNFLVLEDGGKVVSFVYLKYYGKDSHLEYPDMEDLFTKEDQRGKGYGSTLIKECEKLVREKGFKKIGLAVNPDKNDYAKKFYEHLGYKYDGNKSYVDGIYNGVEDWVVDLEKEIV